MPTAGDFPEIISHLVVRGHQGGLISKLHHQISLRETIMKLPRRRFLYLAAGAAALPAASRIASAQTYPTRPVRIIVPFIAGASSDIIARLIAQWLSERLGQQFIVENRTAHPLSLIRSCASATMREEIGVRVPVTGGLSMSGSAS